MDKTVEHLINRQWTSPFLDRFMAIMTNFSVWIPILLLVLLALLWLGRFRARSFVIVTLLSIAITDGLFTQFTKKWANRPRPPEAVAGIREVSLKKMHPAIAGVFGPVEVTVNRVPRTGAPGHSFPSGHSVNNSLIATVAILFFGRVGALYIIPCLLVCYSRIYCGSHWPSDVAFSILIGIAFGLLLPRIFGRLYQMIGQRWFPKLYAKQPDLIPNITLS
jgi:membrane-associated phospholipid phosphatase